MHWKRRSFGYPKQTSNWTNLCSTVQLDLVHSANQLPCQFDAGIEEQIASVIGWHAKALSALRDRFDLSCLLVESLHFQFSTFFMTVQSAEMRSVWGNGNLAEVAPQPGASERCAECPWVGRVSHEQCLISATWSLKHCPYIVSGLVTFMNVSLSSRFISLVVSCRVLSCFLKNN